MRAEQYLLDNRVEVFGEYGDTSQMEEFAKAMKEYTRIKCQELLEIVAEKAKVGSDWKYKGGDSNILGNYTKTLVYKVNKNSILNAVDLEKFCS